MRTTLFEVKSLKDAALTTDLVTAGAGWPVMRVVLVGLGAINNPRGQQLLGIELLVDERWNCPPGWRSLIKIKCRHGHYVDHFAGGCDDCVNELAEDYEDSCFEDEAEAAFGRDE